MRLAFLAAFAVGCSAAAAPPSEQVDPAREAAPAGADADDDDDAPGGGGGGACLPLRDCEAAPFSFTPRGWRHTITSNAVTALGSPRHRGRDFFANPGAPQTIIGKFTYGANDKDLVDEEVDVFAQAECDGDWTKLGTAITTKDGAHATVDGVEDDGGRIYFDIPADKRLGPGRHRLRLVVAGDGTFADTFIDVVPEGTKVFVSDVDGTLTSSEEVEAAALLGGFTPETHASAPEALRALAAKGYRPLYLTARPEMLTERTRAFVAERGFPPGLVRTSPFTTGAFQSEKAARFKTAEMDLLAAKGLTPAFGFGNKTSDSNAYAKIPGEQNRIFYKIEGEFSGRRIESYAELLPAFAELAAVCTP
ncbi:MAG: phosphatidylinositol transfer protein [Labilithrix sp.]|nr:phosphatidylinositol transfer protein [Labilithrix sp.]MCW5811721.1 phosphatidylinositol transfer protein [Labilithrix sp.]